MGQSHGKTGSGIRLSLEDALAVCGLCQCRRHGVLCSVAGCGVLVSAAAQAACQSEARSHICRPSNTGGDGCNVVALMATEDNQCSPFRIRYIIRQGVQRLE